MRVRCSRRSIRGPRYYQRLECHRPGGQSFTYTITATNNTTKFSASGLPPGLTVGSISGVISGIPTAAVTTGVLIEASNVTGSNSRTLAVTINLPLPVITSPLTAAGQAGLSFTYTITASNNPSSFGAAGARDASLPRPS